MALDAPREDLHGVGGAVVGDEVAAEVEEVGFGGVAIGGLVSEPCGFAEVAGVTRGFGEGGFGLREPEEQEAGQEHGINPKVTHLGRRGGHQRFSRVVSRMPIAFTREPV
jgi:hypothetical protein